MGETTIENRIANAKALLEQARDRVRGHPELASAEALCSIAESVIAIAELLQERNQDDTNRDGRDFAVRLHSGK